ncbi:MAG: hypothetical protein LBB61_07430 [Treponema sp.]|jgi:hypothetical protein|nr:hypothetical protein [Treponema sp.]
MKTVTVFVGLGGTGTQIATAIGNLYPVLQEAKIITSPFEMYILDKDTNSGIFKACTSACQRYESYSTFLPFDTLLPAYNLKHNIYQELQEKTGFKDKDYNIMDIIGKDTVMQELAAMCWKEEKREESIKDGNNRDPSRGHLDAVVCLEHLEESSFFAGINKLIAGGGETSVRIVMLGGVTGGMGSSLIVPLAQRIHKKWNNIRIDMVLLGTYFGIPQRPIPKDGKDIDNIGTSVDSYYRAADQIEELAGISTDIDNWRVYYAAMPGFDNTCGEFKKNAPVPRKFHILELCAALAAFAIEEEKPGFYGTALSYDDGDPNSCIKWAEIPLGDKIKKPAITLMRLISILASAVLPELQNQQKIKNSNYLKKYFKGKQSNNIETIERMRELLDRWLQDITPLFNLWNEIQGSTKLGNKNNRQIVSLFPTENKQMENLDRLLKKEKDNFENKIPLLDQEDESWLNFEHTYLKPNKDKLTATKNEPNEILKLMIKDIYTKLQDKEVV